jgi:methylene-fatty-acyl-phospholipid synthase
MAVHQSTRLVLVALGLNSYPRALAVLSVSFLAGLVAAALFFAGQVLNVAIYLAIGEDGVYYGFKLGRKVPWSTAFPFNAGYRHPQYVGAVLSQLGVLLIVTDADTLASGLCVLLAWWVLMYFVTSYVEAKGDNDK